MSAAPPPTVLDIDVSLGGPPIVYAHGVDHAASWATRHRNALLRVVSERGSALVRGLGLHDVAQTAAVFRRLSTDLMHETEGFATRRSYADGVYSSSKWPPSQPMCMHHELSYAAEVPAMLLFACLTAPASNGATATADSAAVLDSLPEALVDAFERDGWLLVRSYNGEIGTSVREAFGTDDRAAVEAYCRSHAVDVEWRGDGSLRTTQRRPAVIAHPNSGRRCWFNQVAFLNAWTMDPEIREYVTDVYGADGLPFDTRYGNGDPVSEDDIALINRTYETLTVRRPWQSGDLMLVDNLRTAHSREAYEGPREVLVGLADPLWLAGDAVRVEGPGR